MNTLLTLFISFLTLNIFAQTPNGSELAKINIQTFDTGNEKLLAVTFKNEKGWHTYWTNPGDAGLPTEFSFKADGKELKLESLEWPTPKKYIEKGDLLTFGYEKLHTFFFKYDPTVEIKNLETNAKWLICKNICIPGQRKLEGSITEGTYQAKKNDFDIKSSQVQEAFAKVPNIEKVPNDLDINLIKYKNGLALLYNFKGDFSQAISNLYALTPHPVQPFSFKRETLRKDKSGNLYGLYTLDWDGEYMEPEIPLPADGKFKTPYKFKFLFNDPVKKKVYTIEKEFSEFLLNQEENLEVFFKGMTKIDSAGIKKNGSNSLNQANSKIPGKSYQNNKIIYFFLMAFLGGIILNIMPCVLPVISIKLFGLINHSSEDNKSIFKHNMAYSLGVFLTFIVLAAIVVGLKATGEQVGWGFQLQSPVFVGIMALVIFVMALNMFGLFEFRTPGGSKLGSVKVEDSFLGDVFGGVLATILSTPCSAPFLGTALTFAFSESPAVIFLIFLSVGLGLALPFILTALFPALIKFLPKPGMWMEHVKKFLGFTLILTTLWLLDVFLALTDSQVALLQMNTALALIFFVIYVREKVTKNLILSFALLIPTAFLFLESVNTQTSSIDSSSAMLKDKSRSELKWEAWSEQRMQELQENKELTFIDFTAKWCLTCKVNEKVVLDTRRFKNLVKQKKMKLLLADWTKRDNIIGSWLQKHGFVGVPAYFVINSQGELVTLGETITVGKIKKALN